jgi:DNA-binding GntR family transcriptional regulator
MISGEVLGMTAVAKPKPAEPTGSRRGRVRVVSPDLGAIDQALETSAEQQIYRLIKRAIMSGVFAPGDSLTSRSLAESFGVSATPVREALKRLEADGVLKSRLKSAYFLPVLAREDYLDLLEIRARVEGFAAATAALAATDRDVAALKRTNRAYSRSGRDIAEGFRLNYRFHFGIYQLTRSPLLLSVIENFWVRSGPTLHFHLHGYGIDQVTDNHDALVAALGRHDAKGAERALRRDLSEAAKVIAPQLPAARRGGPAREFVAVGL